MSDRASSQTAAARVHLRVPPHAGHALGGLWRLALRPFYTPWHWVTLLGLCALFGVLAFAMVPPAEAAQKYLPWAARFYVGFLVPLLAFITAGGALRDDLQPGAVDYLFTRPLRRPQFVLFRYLAHVGTAQINYTVAFGALVAIGLYLQVPGLGAALPRLFAVQVLMLATFSAFGFLAGALTSRYVIVGLVYGAIVEIGLGNVPTALSRLSMSRQGVSLLQPLLGDERIGMGGPLAVAPLSAPTATLVLVGLTVVMLGATAVLFHFREFSGAGGRDA